jgi:hypothetical protein
MNTNINKSSTNFQKISLIVDAIIQVLAVIFITLVLSYILFDMSNTLSGYRYLMFGVFVVNYFTLSFVSNILEMIVQKALVKIRLSYTSSVLVTFIIAFFSYNIPANNKSDLNIMINILNGFLLISTFLAYPILTFYNLWLVFKK